MRSGLRVFNQFEAVDSVHGRLPSFLADLFAQMRVHSRLNAAVIFQAAQYKHCYLQLNKRVLIREDLTSCQAGPVKGGRLDRSS